MGRRERLGRLERSEAACCSSDFVLALAASLSASAESPLLGSIFTCCEGKGSKFLPELIAYEAFLAAWSVAADAAEEEREQPNTRGRRRAKHTSTPATMRFRKRE